VNHYSCRGRHSTPKDHDVIDELKRLKKELAKGKETLDRQASRDCHFRFLKLELKAATSDCFLKT
jgi:predicted Zn-ribbon and HTH transcriptional regulator